MNRLASVTVKTRRMQFLWLSVVTYPTYLLSREIQTRQCCYSVTTFCRHCTWARNDGEGGAIWG